jgi:hypothetical protein
MLSTDGLANSGGPTETIALASGSPAIDAIPVADLRLPDRNFNRPKIRELGRGGFWRVAISVLGPFQLRSPVSKPAMNQLQISACIVRASLRLMCCARRLAAVANHFDGADGPE